MEQLLHRVSFLMRAIQQETAMSKNRNYTPPAPTSTTLTIEEIMAQSSATTAGTTGTTETGEPATETADVTEESGVEPATETTTGEGSTPPVEQPDTAAAGEGANGTADHNNGSDAADNAEPVAAGDTAGDAGAGVNTPAVEPVEEPVEPVLEAAAEATVETVAEPTDEERLPWLYNYGSNCLPNIPRDTAKLWAAFCVDFPGMLRYLNMSADVNLIPNEHRETFAVRTVDPADYVRPE